MKAFKYSSSHQPTIRVVEMENPHHHFTYNNHGGGGGTSFSAAVPPPTSDDSELSIFDAQKYFNESNENPNPEKPKSNAIITAIRSPSPPPPPYGNLPTSLPRRLSSSSVSSSIANSRQNYRDGSGGVRSFSFPTASSEASWNSQTGLLANRPGSVQVNLREFPSNNNEHQKRESSSSWFSWLICPCAGKKSVRVHGGGTPCSVAGNSYTHQQKEDHKPEVGKVSIKPQITATQKEFTVPISLSLKAADQNSPLPAIMIQAPQQRLSSSGMGNTFSDGNSVAFSFPILNQTFPAPAPKIEVLRRVLPPPLMAASDPPRDSLEVFQPQVDSIPSNPMLFTNPSGGSGGSGGSGRGLPFLGSPTKAARDDDVASDASSDLFEIESFSTQHTSSTYSMYYYQRRDSLEEATTFNARRRLVVAATGGGMAGRNSYSRRSIDEEEVMNESEYGYEPSEASIDWSVTTAEGFDRASMTNYSIAASGMEEPSMTRREWEVHNSGMEGGKGKNNKAKGMGLLSCRREKAVGSKGPQLMRCTAAEEGHDGAGAARAVGSTHPFQFLSTLRHVNGRVATNKASKPPLIGTSHLDRLSLGFAA